MRSARDAAGKSPEEALAATLSPLVEPSLPAHSIDRWRSSCPDTELIAGGALDPVTVTRSGRQETNLPVKSAPQLPLLCLPECGIMRPLCSTCSCRKRVWRSGIYCRGARKEWTYWAKPWEPRTAREHRDEIIEFCWYHSSNPPLTEELSSRMRDDGS